MMAYPRPADGQAAGGDLASRDLTIVAIASIADQASSVAAIVASVGSIAV